ncbi:MAG: hypothetical protein JXB48_11105 [Candidatus Latescibacteria bacterium]|nr:hypothetical protein [Candidatus Latescibacterota bacterium]
MGKSVCPIISGNPRYFGLTQIEWAISLFVFFFINLVPFPFRYVGYALWVVGVIIYPKISKMFEENFAAVLIESCRIPSTLIGHFRRAVPPLDRQRKDVQNDLV